MRRAAILAGLAVACGGITDPLGVHPGAILGEWRTLSTSLATPQQIYEAIIVAGDGSLEGRFDFEVSSVPLSVSFDRGTWDGETLVFTTPDVLAGTGEEIQWTALWVPAEEGAPAQLRLFPRVAGGVPFAITYVRPDDLDFLRFGTVAR